MKKRRRRRLKPWVKKSIIFILIILFINILLSIKNNINKNNTDTINNYDIESLKKVYNNNDIIAKLVIKDIELNTVVTKTSNNVYYLKYNAYRKTSDYGNPFIDYRNSINLENESQINIYGHNIKGNYTLPFYNLTKYLNKEIFDNSSEILLYTYNAILRYKLYAIKIVTENEREHMIIDSKYITRDEHLKRLLTNTKYCKDDCKLNDDEDILILQTCNFKPNDTYIIVIAKKV